MIVSLYRPRETNKPQDKDPSNYGPPIIQRPYRRAITNIAQERHPNVRVGSPLIARSRPTPHGVRRRHVVTHDVPTSKNNATERYNSRCPPLLAFLGPTHLPPLFVELLNSGVCSSLRKELSCHTDGGASSIQKWYPKNIGKHDTKGTPTEGNPKPNMENSKGFRGERTMHIMTRS